jgi:hypothetical protein
MLHVKISHIDYHNHNYVIHLASWQIFDGHQGQRFQRKDDQKEF